MKILADVVESYLAALLLDKGLDYCRKFLEACLFPKLMVAIIIAITCGKTNICLYIYTKYVGDS